MENNFSELIEYLDKKFNKIDGDIKNFKDSTSKNFDMVFKDLEMLKQEKDVGKLNIL